MNAQRTYWQRLMGGLDALLGRTPPAPGPAAPAVDTAGYESRIRALALDIEDRDRKIEQMRQEYATLQANRERAVGDAGQDQLLRFFKKLAGTLSNLAALAAFQEAGRDVAAADFAALARSLEKEFHKAGLERIGAPGQTAAFDVALHQRMSGAAIPDGGAVTIRMPGYRSGAQVLLKAMVTVREDAHG